MKSFAEWLCDKYQLDHAAEKNYYDIEFYQQNWVNVLERYFENVEKELGFGKYVVLSKKRNRQLCLIRFVAMYYVRKNYPVSLNEIGRYFFKDHSSIIHGVRLIEDLLEVNNAERENIKKLLNLF